MGKMLNKAIIIATKAHEGQVDKGGDDYILHPLRVMLSLQREEDRIVAILHDIIEDTNITFDVLKKEGFSDEIIIALKHMTRGKKESYMDYIRRAKTCEISRRVKIADLKDNMDISRIKEPTKKDYNRLKRYKKALNILLEKGK